jgi:hypothetical protein
MNVFFRQPVFATALVLMGAAASANAQTINNLLLNNSSQNAYWWAWDSIYGTNLPVSSYTWVQFDYPAIVNAQYTVEDSIISSSTQYQTYWYDSSTQINVYLYPQQSGAVAGCLPNGAGGEWCDAVQACGNGYCTNFFIETMNGNP